mmetsp:Transcript_107657/g.246509  ORF Transcript_107657/g.246509 Transcript_107657/m.246509 type:complete len:117 (+) Transcript_107657:751-1101(+)
MNADGALDIVGPVCSKLHSGLSWTWSSEPGDSQILVLWNQQKPMCESKWTSSSANCQRQANWCVASDFSFAAPSDWKCHILPQSASVQDGELDLNGDSAVPTATRTRSRFACCCGE